MSLLRYGAHKDSGVALLGAIPAHWEASVLKRVVSQVESGVSVNAVDEPASLDGVGVLKTSCVYSGNFDPRENKTVVIEDLERVACPVKAGTLIVSRMNTPALVGAAGLVQEDADNLFLPDRLWQVHFSRALPKFAHYWTTAPSYRAQVQMACAGTSASMQNLSQEEFLRFLLPLPPQDEQADIAAFLDRETAKIDALITEQEKLIALLAEKRQATISHAVTRGLNPNAPMKDSGVAWLGQVPAHWNVLPIKRDLAFLTSGSRGWAEHYADDGALFIRIGNLTRDRVELDLSDIQRVSVPEGAEGERTRVKPGDLLFSITAYLGSVAVVPESIEPAFVSQHVALARLRSTWLLPVWVAYVCLSWVGATYLASQGYGGTKVQLSLDDVGNLISTAPPLEEQRAILHFLERETSKLDALSAQAQHGITLLKERRSALIAAAVTGQIDVRHT